MLKSKTTDCRKRNYELLRLRMVWIYRILLIAIMALGICVFKTLPLRLVFPNCLVVMGVYLFLIIVLQETYHACSIGRARVTELIMSQLLANLICLGAIYFGAVLYIHRFFNPAKLFMVFVLQSLLGVLWSVHANKSYCKNRPLLRATVFCGKEAALDQVCGSPYFKEKFTVVKTVYDPQPDDEALRSALQGSEAAFTIDVSSMINNTIAKHCLQMGIKGYFAPRLGQIIMTGAQFRANFGIPMLRVSRAGGPSEYRLLKRIFDFGASAVAILVLWPLMLVVAAAIWMEDHGPVFYRQVRLTRDGREFKILKFRSMTVNAEKDGVARLAGQNDSRITRVGRFIRACRLDELPQLFNILAGDMSIVGPRPERPEIAAQYEETLPEFGLRLQVKAGLTGVAQVYGRYNTEPYHKLQMDLMYINEMSFLKDMQLILATIRILFVKESTQGVTHGGQTALSDGKLKDKTA